jgi:hypothetical protein
MDVLWVIGENNKERNHEMRFLRLVEGVRILEKWQQEHTRKDKYFLTELKDAGCKDITGLIEFKEWKMKDMQNK